MRGAGAEPDLAEQFPGNTLRIGPARHIRAELDVLQRGQAGKQVEALEDEADRVTADQRPLRPRRGRQVPPCQPDRPGGGSVQRADQGEQRCLSRAGRAQHDDESGLIDMQVDIIERLHHGIARAEPPAHTVQVDPGAFRPGPCIYSRQSP